MTDRIAFSRLKGQNTGWQGIKDLMGLEELHEFCFKGEMGMVGWEHEVKGGFCF